MQLSVRIILSAVQTFIIPVNLARGIQTEYRIWHVNVKVRAAVIRNASVCGTADSQAVLDRLV